MKRLKSLLSDKKGTIAVETAIIVASVLLPTMLSLWDMITIYKAKAQVDQAQVGAIAYILSNPTAASATGVQTAAQAVSGNTIQVSSTAACYCVQMDTTSPIMPTPTSCSGSCSTSAVLQQFLTVVTSEAVTIPFPVSFIGLQSPYAVSSSSSTRTS